ncbi:hypothetical protein FKP32DRAFT_1009089 [Trametes sanguinea]|nr:hypothetical protein FKP32DRAFT_1009089 [Trametes sanguinea]
MRCSIPPALKEIGDSICASTRSFTIGNSVDVFCPPPSRCQKPALRVHQPDHSGHI